MEQSVFLARLSEAQYEYFVLKPEERDYKIMHSRLLLRQINARLIAEKQMIAARRANAERLSQVLLGKPIPRYAQPLNADYYGEVLDTRVPDAAPVIFGGRIRRKKDKRKEPLVPKPDDLRLPKRERRKPGPKTFKQKALAAIRKECKQTKGGWNPNVGYTGNWRR